MTQVISTSSEIHRILTDPCASFWLKQAVERLMQRDIVDAAHDAQRLAMLFQRRCDEQLAVITDHNDGR
jgi:hypothetical protein